MDSAVNLKINLRFALFCCSETKKFIPEEWLSFYSQCLQHIESYDTTLANIEDYNKIKRSLLAKARNLRTDSHPNSTNKGSPWSAMQTATNCLSIIHQSAEESISYRDKCFSYACDAFPGTSKKAVFMKKVKENFPGIEPSMLSTHFDIWKSI